jgi:hypothetical protein
MGSPIYITEVGQPPDASDFLARIKKASSKPECLATVNTSELVKAAVGIKVDPSPANRNT